MVVEEEEEQAEARLVLVAMGQILLSTLELILFSLLFNTWEEVVVGVVVSTQLPPTMLGTAGSELVAVVGPAEILDLTKVEPVDLVVVVAGA